MKKFMENLTGKQIVSAIITFVCLLLWCGLTVFSSLKKNSLMDQTAADRWSPDGGVAQVSCFFTESTEIDKNKIMEFEQKLNSVLLESSITSENENARLWADAYSAPGMVTLEYGKAKLEAQALGIGGDFFLFHPVRLLEGAYFSGNDLMHDKVIIDEEAAWQLFGSNDVTGMQVMIGGVPHYIAGIIKRADGRINEAAGLDKTLVYLSGESLIEYGKTTGINTYEVLMPNPISSFAYTKIKENFGLDENSMWVVDNTARFQMKPLFMVLTEFGTRSMNAHAIRYPYWENIARGWEDILAVVLLFQILFLLIPAGILLTTLIFLWKKRKWTVRDIPHAVCKGWNAITGRIHMEKNKWKDF